MTIFCNTSRGGVALTNVFDFKEFYDEDYLYFTVSSFTPEFNDREVEIIWILLELEPDMVVLDLGRGYGRIGNRLALRGCQVTGLDTIDRFLEMARQEAKSLDLDVMYMQGNMRALPWSEGFNRVVNWFSK
jgi:2-polyprenyl-3-methyl-5-hydroxy-6-metoxy-1,4-benzoquinol methylase